MAPCLTVPPGKAQLLLTQTTVAGTLWSVQSSWAWEVAPLLSPSLLTDEGAKARSLARGHRGSEEQSQA